MNEIVMIPVEELIHHPENPRKDLGDLTELAESIKANGVMQNLTVVPADRAEFFSQGEKVCEEKNYFVVIGNRRMEAAKIAGLAELPCVISDMDHKAQVATMLMENMQRQDLTVYEQAQGFQMMMDLGYSAKEIGEKTGFSEKTVKDRIKFTKFNQKNFQEAVAKGATLLDMIEISKLKSKADQNEVMKEAGTNNFRRTLLNKLGEQKYKDSCEALKKLAEEAGISALPENANVYGGGEYTWTDCKPEAGEGEEKIRKKLKKIVKENQGEELFYKFSRNWNDDTACMSVLRKNRKKEQQDASQEEQEQKERDRARQRKLREIKKLWAEAYRLRVDFIRNYTVTTNGTGMTTIGKLILKYSLRQQNSWNHKLPENQHWKEKYIRDTLEIQQEEYEEKKSLWELVEARGIPQIRAIIAWMMGGGVFDADNPEFGRYNYYDGHWENGGMGQLAERYEFLQEIGYEMSDMEKQLMDGSHACYGGGGE